MGQKPQANQYLPPRHFLSRVATAISSLLAVGAIIYLLCFADRADQKRTTTIIRPAGDRWETVATLKGDFTNISSSAKPDILLTIGSPDRVVLLTGEQKLSLPTKTSSLLFDFAITQGRLVSVRDKTLLEASADGSWEEHALSVDDEIDQIAGNDNGLIVLTRSKGLYRVLQDRKLASVSTNDIPGEQWQVIFRSLAITGDDAIWLFLRHPWRYYSGTWKRMSETPLKYATVLYQGHNFLWLKARENIVKLSANGEIFMREVDPYGNPITLLSTLISSPLAIRAARVHVDATGKYYYLYDIASGKLTECTPQKCRDVNLPPLGEKDEVRDLIATEPGAITFVTTRREDAGFIALIIALGVPPILLPFYPLLANRKERQQALKEVLERAPPPVLSDEPRGFRRVLALLFRLHDKYVLFILGLLLTVLLFSYLSEQDQHLAAVIGSLALFVLILRSIFADTNRRSFDLLLQGRTTEALEIRKRLSRSSRYLTAYARLLQCQWSEAEKLFAEMVRTERLNVNAALGLAAVWQALERDDDAAKACYYANLLEPFTSSQPYLLLAELLLLERRDYDVAQECLKRSSGPGSGDAATFLRARHLAVEAILAAHSGQTAEAKRKISKAFKRVKKRYTVVLAWLHIVSALIALEQNDSQTAHAELDTAAQLNPAGLFGFLADSVRGDCCHNRTSIDSRS